MKKSDNLSKRSLSADSVHVALALVERSGTWLINRRLSGDALDGLWEFPGGRIRNGESPAEAVVRECAEETGVIVDAMIDGSPVTHRYSANVVTLLPVFCRWVRGEGVSGEAKVGEVRWVTVDELRGLAMPAANDRVVQQILERGG